MYGKLQNKKSTNLLVVFDWLESLCQNNQVQGYDSGRKGGFRDCIAYIKSDMKGTVQSLCGFPLLKFHGVTFRFASTLVSKLLPQKKVESVRTKQKQNKNNLPQKRFTSFVETLDWIPNLTNFRSYLEEKFQSTSDLTPLWV